MTGQLPHPSAEPRVLWRRGCPLHYWLEGAAGLPLVALLHGVTMDHRMFAPQVTALAAAGRYRVLAMDVRGHGRSRPLGHGFSIPEAADDLAAVLDQVGGARAAVVGQSMGGYIAQELVFRRPERVWALAIVGSTCSTFRQPAAVRLGLPLTAPGIRFLPDAVLRPLLGLLGSVRPRVQASAVTCCRQVPKQDLVTIWDGIIGHFHEEPGYRIEQPLLLTHGAWDWGIGFGAIPLLAPRWAAREPRCSYRVIPAAGHLANQDNPGCFNRMLLDFLDRHRPAAAEPSARHRGAA